MPSDFASWCWLTTAVGSGAVGVPKVGGGKRLGSRGGPKSRTLNFEIFAEVENAGLVAKADPSVIRGDAHFLRELLEARDAILAFGEERDETRSGEVTAVDIAPAFELAVPVARHRIERGWSEIIFGRAGDILGAEPLEVGAVEANLIALEVPAVDAEQAVGPGVERVGPEQPCIPVEVAQLSHEP